jgi:NifB/MoaA-like Fe-S oxidoreductase
MSLETETKTEEEIDTSNIFEEFNDDSELKKEVKGMVDSQEKDIFYYLSIVGKFAQNTFWILLLLLAFLYGYIFIQENENIKDSNILDPFCVIFL